MEINPQIQGESDIPLTSVPLYPQGEQSLVTPQEEYNAEVESEELGQQELEIAVVEAEVQRPEIQDIERYEEEEEETIEKIQETDKTLRVKSTIILEEVNELESHHLTSETRDLPEKYSGDFLGSVAGNATCTSLAYGYESEAHMSGLTAQNAIQAQQQWNTQQQEIALQSLKAIYDLVDLKFKSKGNYKKRSRLNRRKMPNILSSKACQTLGDLTNLIHILEDYQNNSVLKRDP
jgi:hypothetical protein